MPAFAPFFVYAAASLLVSLGGENIQKPQPLSGPDVYSVLSNAAAEYPVAQAVVQLSETGFAHPAAVEARDALFAMAETAGCQRGDDAR